MAWKPKFLNTPFVNQTIIFICYKRKSVGSISVIFISFAAAHAKLLLDFALLRTEKQWHIYFLHRSVSTALKQASIPRQFISTCSHRKLFSIKNAFFDYCWGQFTWNLSTMLISKKAKPITEIHITYTTTLASPNLNLFLFLFLRCHQKGGLDYSIHYGYLRIYLF